MMKRDEKLRNTHRDKMRKAFRFLTLLLCLTKHKHDITSACKCNTRGISVAAAHCWTEMPHSSLFVRYFVSDYVFCLIAQWCKFTVHIVVPWVFV